jgi:hypothetical protein
VSFLLSSVDCFVNNFFCVVFQLHFDVRIQIFHLLVLADVLILLLPLSLSLSINLRDVTLGTESYLGETDELIRKRQNLLAEFLVRLAALINVLLDNLRITVHASLALSDRFNHVGGLLGYALDDTLQVLHRLHPLVILVGEKVLDIQILFLFLHHMLSSHFLMLNGLFLLNSCVYLLSDPGSCVIQGLKGLLVK